MRSRVRDVTLLTGGTDVGDRGCYESVLSIFDLNPFTGAHGYME